MKTRVLTSGLCALLLTLGGSAVANAADPVTVYNKMASSSDPVATWNSLSAAQQAAYTAYQTPSTTKVTKTSTLSPMLLTGGGYGSCWKRGYKAVQYNSWGNPLFSWTMYTTWCGDGHVVSDYSNRGVGETYAAFWSWSAQGTPLSVYRAPDPDRLDSFGQAEFKLCLVSGIGCVMYRYPWIDMDGDATGWHSFSYGGL